MQLGILFQMFCFVLSAADHFIDLIPVVLLWPLALCTFITIKQTEVDDDVATGHLVK